MTKFENETCFEKLSYPILWKTEKPYANCSIARFNCPTFSCKNQLQTCSSLSICWLLKFKQNLTKMNLISWDLLYVKKISWNNFNLTNLNTHSNKLDYLSLLQHKIRPQNGFEMDFWLLSKILMNISQLSYQQFLHSTETKTRPSKPQSHNLLH